MSFTRGGTKTFVEEERVKANDCDSEGEGGYLLIHLCAAKYKHMHS